MSFFTSAPFWFLEGILFCLMLVGLKVAVEDRGKRMSFWKWPLLFVWLLLTGFTIAFVGTSLGEGEIHAAMKGGIIFGLLCLVTGVGLKRILLPR